MRNKILIIFLSLLFAVNVVAQTFSVSELRTQSLLPTASIHCIMQDSEGYLWYATERAGVCRDNGYQIDVFAPSDLAGNAQANHILCIGESVSGNIYLGTPVGLFMLDKSDYRLYPTDIKNVRVNALFTDSGGLTWVGTESMIYALDKNSSTVFKTKSLFSGRTCAVSRFYEDSKGRLFTLQWNGGILLRNNKKNVFEQLAWHRDSSPISMQEDKDRNCYWVATRGEGIIKCNIGNDITGIELQEMTTGSYGREHAFDLLLDSRNSLLWITTPDDLYAYRITKGKLEPFPTDTFLPEGKKIVDQMLMTDDGSIYVAGFTPHTFILHQENNRIERMSIDAMREHSGYPVLADRSIHEKHYIWIWQGRIGLSLYNTTDKSLLSADLNVERCIRRNISEKSGLWAAKGSYVYRVWTDDGLSISYNQIPLQIEGSINNIVDDGKGNLFILTNKDLYKYNINNELLKHIVSLPGTPVDMEVSLQGETYVIIEDRGLYIITEEGKFSQLSTGKEIFTSLASGPDDTVWLTTLAGNVYCYDAADKSLSKKDFMHSVNDAPLRDINVDGLGHVWTVSDQSIVEYDVNTMAFREISASDPDIDVTYFYGIENIDATHMCINGAGALCIAESTPALGKSVTDLSPMVSGYYVDGIKNIVCRGMKETAVDPDNTNITLCLTTLEHIDSDKIVFACKLEGLNKDWIYNEAGNNTFTFNALPKGTYKVYVKATDGNGCWSKPQMVHQITILPFWYETWWARLLFLSVLLVVCYLIWKLERRIRLLNRLISRRRDVRLDEIELKREDISSDLRDDEFLRNAISKVEENLGRSDYNVELLSKDLCMSRITLYRKIQQQTGLTPVEFIRDIRLKKAAQLILQDSHATIADISRKVGFATPKYFSRCFKEKFGVLPKDYH